MIQRKSILFINRVYPPHRGASGRVLQDLAEHCAKNGWHTSVLTTGKDNRQTQENGVNVTRIKGAEKPANAFAYLWILIRLFMTALKLPQSTIIVTLTDPPLLILAGDLLQKIKKCTHIHWSHDVYPDLLPVIGKAWPRLLQRSLRYKTRRAMNKAHKVVAIGECMKQHLAHTGCNTTKIEVITNWANFELYSKDQTTITNEGTPHHLGSKPHAYQIKSQQKFKVMYAGTIGRAHPMDTILQAAHILKNECPDVELVFVGEGVGFDTLAKERAKQGLTNIRFMPYQPSSRLKYTMESGDLHLISMHEDAAGLLVPSKIYSAVAVHRPCIFIGPHQSDAARIIKQYGAGMIVNQSDSHGLAEAIKSYRQSSEKWYQDYDGAAVAAMTYTPETSLKKWITLLNSVVL